MRTKNFKIALALTAILVFLSQSVFSQTEWLKVGSDPNRYESAVDSINQHDGKNVVTLRSVESKVKGFGALMQNVKPDQYLGKRIRMTGYLKTKNIKDWTGLWFRVDQAGSQQFLSFDNMEDRPVKGTTGWEKYEIVLDVPNHASNIAFGVLLSKTGQIWVDKINFEVVDNSVSTTGKKKEVK